MNGYILWSRSAMLERANFQIRRGLARADLGLPQDPFVLRVTCALVRRDFQAIVDVGASEGQFASLMRAAGFSGRIECFEPLPDIFERLGIRFHSDSEWHVHQLALGIGPGRLLLNIAGSSYSFRMKPTAALYRKATRESETVGQVDVEMQCPAHRFASCSIDPALTSIKIYAQGYELEVLAGSAFMTEHGFEMAGIEPGVCDSKGRFLQADISFL